MRAQLSRSTERRATAAERVEREEREREVSRRRPRGRVGFGHSCCECYEGEWSGEGEWSEVSGEAGKGGGSGKGCLLAFLLWCERSLQRKSLADFEVVEERRGCRRITWLASAGGD